MTETLLEFVKSLHSPEGLGNLVKTGGLLALIFIVFAETGLLVGFFLPGDSLLVTAGIFAASDGAGGPGLFNVWVLVFSLSIAAVVGDQLGYLLGRKSGPLIFSKEDSFLFKKKHVQAAHDFYERHGAGALILARFMPIFRTFVPFVAGVAQMDYQKFVRFNIIGGIVWVWSMIFLGFALGHSPLANQIHKIIVVVVILSILPMLIGVARKIFAKKKVSSVVIFLGLLTSTVAQAVSVRADFRSSQVQSFLVFLSQVTQTRKESALKDLYLKSDFNTPKSSALLEDIDILPWLEDNESPDLQHPAFQLLVQSAYARNLNEFSARTLGVFAPPKHKKLFETFHEFLPLYNRLLWSDSQKFIESYVHSLERSGTLKKLNTNLNKVAFFLRSDWPEDVSLPINLYPIPKEGAYIDANYQWGVSLGVPLEDKDVSQGIERTYAQACQVLMEARRDDVRAEWNDYLLNLSSFPSARFFQRRFSEILSFALAKQWVGLFQQKQKGTHWLEMRLGEHEAVYVEDLQDLIGSYLGQGKKIDRPFVVEAINIFEKKHADALLRYSLVFEKTLFWLSNDLPLDGTFWKIFARHFPRGNFSNSPSSEATAILSPPDEGHSYLFVLRKKDRNNFNKLAQLIPELKKEVKNFESGKDNRVWAFIDAKNRPIVLVRTESLEGFEQVLKDMAEQKAFDRKTLLQKLMSSEKVAGPGETST